jgi:mannonate dehydratase
MKVGTQHDSSNETLAVLAALGVTHVCSRLPSVRLDEQWSVEGLTRLRDRVESFGIRLDMVPLPLSSLDTAHAEMPNIMLGRSPERDREIDDICRMIRNASRAGVPALKYNMSVLGVVRTEPTAGRGGARYSTFNYEKARQEPPLTQAGPVPPTSTGSGSRTSSSEWFRWRRRARSAWPATRTIPACPLTRVTAESTRFSEASRA